MSLDIPGNWPDDASQEKRIAYIERALDEVEKRGAERMRERAAKECDKREVCRSTGHDDRWCAHCRAQEDMADLIQQKICALPVDGKKE